MAKKILFMVCLIFLFPGLVGAENWTRSSFVAKIKTKNMLQCCCQRMLCHYDIINNVIIDKIKKYNQNFVFENV